MFVEDLTVYFDTANGFAVNAAVGGATVPVIFDKSYLAAMGFAESSVPQCVGRSVDLASAVQGTAITINAVAYRVTEHQPDGTGVTTLLLEKA